MDANTPATQPLPTGPADEGRPAHHSPIGDSPVKVSPIQDRVGAPASTPAQGSTDDRRPAHNVPPARPQGPNAWAVILGLVALLIAAAIIATETMSVRVDWLALGPGAIVGIGALLVVLGAVGLARRRDEG